MQFRPVTSRGPFPIAIEKRPEALSRSDMPDSYALVPRLSGQHERPGTCDRRVERNIHAEARAEAAERPGVEPASAGQVDVGRQAGRPGRAPPVLAPEGTERRRKSSGAAGDRRDGFAESGGAHPRHRPRVAAASGPGRRLTRRDLRCRCCPDRGLSEDSVERQVEERPARGAPSWPGAPPPDLRVDLPDVDHGARVLGDRGEDRRVVEASAGCPSPQRNFGARPPRTTTGEPLKCAVATPDTPLVPLGPAVRTGRRPGPTLGSRLGR